MGLVINTDNQEGLVPETPKTVLRHGISYVDVVTIGPFRLLSIELDQGVNVIVGDNGTGKTWLLKLMYAVIKRDPWLGLEVDRAAVMASRLRNLFLPADRALGRIIRHGARSGTGAVLVTVHPQDRVATVRVRLNHEVSTDENVMRSDGVLIPAGDVLAIYEGFRPLYAERAISVDATYADACAAVGLPALRSPGDTRMKLIAVLEAALGGSMTQRGGRFYLKLHSGKGDVEAHLMSEGHRKIGLLALLIANGSVGPGRTLFWDQPDVSIGPRLLLVVAEVLRGLAEIGAQIIVTTHSPVLLSALAPQKIVRLVQDEAGGVVQAPEGYPVALMTTTALLSEYWGVSKIDPTGLGAAVSRLGYLGGDPGRSPREDIELGELRAKLAAHGLDPDWEPVPIDPTLQRKDAP